MKRPQRILGLTLTIAFTMCLAACGGSGGENSPGASGATDTGNSSPSHTLTIAMTENIVRTDPQNPGTLGATFLMNQIFDALIDEDHEGNYTPMLATDWNMSDDGLTWTFKLREGVTFHNGEPFDAKDVVCSFERLLNDPTLNIKIQYWPTLAGVKAINDFEVEVYLSAPYASALQSFACTRIIPDEAYAQYGEEFFTEHICYGTGPWKYEEWIDGQYISMTKNEDFWGGNDSYYDKFVARFITEQASAVQAHVSGTVNALLALDGFNSDLQTLYDGTDDRIRVFSQDVSSVLYIGLQCGKGPFADENVRIAFEYAIDRQLIADSIFEGRASLPNSVLLETCIGGDPTAPNYEYNPEKAKEYLEKSSYNGEPIQLSSNVATTKSDQVLLAICEMLNEVGFNASMSIVESATLQEMRSTGDYDAFLVSWKMQHDPFSFINQRIMDDAHHTNLVNPEINDIILASNSELDPNARHAMLKDIVTMMQEQHGPYYPVLRTEALFAIDKGVTGLEPYSDGWFNFRDVDYDPSLV